MRSAVAALAALLLSAGVATAGEPGTIGGRLSATPTAAHLVSQGTLPVDVTMTGDYVTVTPDHFTLAPGATMDMTLSGPPLGDVRAHLTAVQSGTGEGSSLTLGVTLKPAAAPPDWTPVGIAILAALGLLIAIRRWRLWEVRLSRASRPA